MTQIHDQTYHIAIVGATGAVGRELIDGLIDREFPCASLRLFASSRSAGERIPFRGQNLLVEDLSAPHVDLAGIQIAFFSAGGQVSRNHVARFIKVGAVVIDNTNAFRMQPAVPLVVPEVNPHTLRQHRGLIANPNCSTIQLMSPLKQLSHVSRLKRIVVSTYQSSSGAGQEAMDELRDQTIAILNFKDPPVKNFPRRLAFDVIPWIGSLLDDGNTDEEAKMVNESQKILELPSLQVSVTCVRVPTFIGHALSVNVEFENDFTLDEIYQALNDAPDLVVCDDQEFPTTHDVVGQDLVWIGRIRRDQSIPFGLNMWVCADNLRKGAATNAIQIGELLVEQDLVRVPSLV